MIARSIAIIYPFEKFFKTNSTCFTFGKLIIFFHCDLFKSQFKIFSINEISFFFFPLAKIIYWNRLSKHRRTYFSFIYFFFTYFFFISFIIAIIFFTWSNWFIWWYQLRIYNDLENFITTRVSFLISFSIFSSNDNTSV